MIDRKLNDSEPNSQNVAHPVASAFPSIKKTNRENRTFEYTNRNNRGVDHLRNDDPGSSLYMRRENQIGEVRTLVLDLYEREGWKALGYSSWRDAWSPNLSRARVVCASCSMLR